MTQHQLDVLWNVFGWVAAILNVVGNITIATKSKSGWIIRIIVNLLWMPYGVYTKAWALIANHALFIAINAWGWWKWNRDEMREYAPGDVPRAGETEKRRRAAYVLGFSEGRIAERRARVATKGL